MLLAYRWQQNESPYAPCNLYPGLGRFGDGTVRTVYVAETARGAMAEFFRRSPELIDFQDDLTVVLFELDLSISGDCLDVRDAPEQLAVGITVERLTSSEVDEGSRYGECRALARQVVNARLTGIFYPSAAATWSPAWNLVLFAASDPVEWECLEHRPVDRPRLDAAEVSPMAFT